MVARESGVGIEIQGEEARVSDGESQWQKKQRAQNSSS